MQKIVVVTGGACGIGRAISVRAARDGYAVVILDRQDAREIVTSIHSMGGDAESLQCDVGDTVSVADAFARIYDEYHNVDVLINNAGTMGRWPLRVDETTDEDWQRIFDTNVKGVYLCCRSVLAEMRIRRSGSIVNVASELALVGAEG